MMISLIFQVLEHMDNDDGTEPVHVINLDVIDNHEEATVGAFLICDMMTLVKFTDYSFKLQQFLQINTKVSTLIYICVMI